MKQLKKLPAWARVEIERLTADNEHYKKQLDEARGITDAETNTYVWGGMEHKPMPNNTAIVFKIAGKGDFSVRVKHDGLNINYHSLGGHQMAIRPHVSNEITLVCVED